MAIGADDDDDDGDVIGLPFAFKALAREFFRLTSVDSATFPSFGLDVLVGGSATLLLKAEGNWPLIGI